MMLAGDCNTIRHERRANSPWFSSEHSADLDKTPTVHIGFRQPNVESPMSSNVSLEVVGGPSVEAKALEFSANVCLTYLSQSNESPAGRGSRMVVRLFGASVLG